MCLWISLILISLNPQFKYPWNPHVMYVLEIDIIYILEIDIIYILKVTIFISMKSTLFIIYINEIHAIYILEIHNNYILKSAIFISWNPKYLYPLFTIFISLNPQYLYPKIHNIYILKFTIFSPVSHLEISIAMRNSLKSKKSFPSVSNIRRICLQNTSAFPEI